MKNKNKGQLFCFALKRKLLFYSLLVILMGGFLLTKITFASTIPDSTTLTIKTRTSEDGILWGAWSGAYSSGDDITQSGKYIQWKADMTGEEFTPEIDRVSIFYVTPTTEVKNP